MISLYLAALLVNPLNSWGYTPPEIPTLSPEQEATFERVFQWDAKNENELPAVLQAVIAGDLQRLKNLQQQGAYIPLQYAAIHANSHGHLETVKWLLDQGAVLPPEAYYAALLTGNMPLIQWWWQKPSYERLSSDDAYEPFIITALKSGSFELVEAFLQRGESLPTQTEIRQEIFWSLVTHDHEELFSWLTQTQGWSFAPEELDSVYDHAMIDALQMGDFKRVQRLVRMGYPVQDLSQKEELLIYAAHGGNLQVVQWLAKQGVPIQPTKAQHYYLHIEGKYLELGLALFGGVNALNYTSIELQLTALEEAQTQGHTNIAEWLTQQGATPLAYLIEKESVSEQDTPSRKRVGCRSIQCEIYNYQTGSATEKIRRVPYIILDDHIGGYGLSYSPLVTAVKAEYLPWVQYILLRYPEKIHEKTWMGSLLHVAVKTQSTAMVKFLLERGADPFALDLYGRTPLDMSIDLQHQPIYNLLRNAEIKAIANKKQERL